MFVVDDQSAFHAKILKAGNEAWGVYCRAGAWSSALANLTEGHIPPEVCASMAPPEVWARLRTVGLTEPPADGSPGEQIHDYLKYNPTAASVRAKLEAHRERSKRWRDGSRDARVTRHQPVTESARDAHVTRIVTPDPDPLPLPDPKIDPHRAREASVVLSGTTPPVAIAPSVVRAPEGLEPDLLALAADLEAEGSDLGRDVRERVAKGWRPTPGQLATLRKIAIKRAAMTAESSATSPAGQRAPPRGRSTAQQCPASDEGMFKGKVY